MIIGCTSDWHGHLVPIPDEVELLLITGDILWHSTPKTYNLRKEVAYLNKIFAPFIERQLNSRSVWITWGNHDLIAERDFGLMPKILQEISLINRSVVYNGMRIYGTPYQPIYRNWAFNKSDIPDSLGQIYSLIPDDVDILMTHCPPYGILDMFDDENSGSRMLAARLKEISPKIHCFGHIHSGYGKICKRGTTFINGAAMDERYILTNSPVLIEHN